MQVKLGGLGPVGCGAQKLLHQAGQPPGEGSVRKWQAGGKAGPSSGRISTLAPPCERRACSVMTAVSRTGKPDETKATRAISGSG